MKRIVALFLCAVTLLLSACAGDDFDYVTSDMTDYYDLDLSELIGGTYDLDIPDEITEEDAWRELRRLQLYYAAHGGGASLDIYTGSPEFGDEAHIYFDIALSPDGESLVSNLFSPDGSRGVTIGLWEFPEEMVETYNPILDGKVLSEALLSTLPATRVKEGAVERGDVIVLDYDVLDKDNVRTESKTEVRIDTSTLYLYENHLPGAVLEALVGKTVGEEFSVSHTFTPKEGAEAVTETYRCIVTHKVEETFSTVAVDVPADAFDEEYSDVMRSLNGKTVYVRYVLARYVDYTVPVLGNKFYIETLGLVTDETDPDKVQEAAIAQIVYQKQQTRLLNVIYPRVTDVIFDKLFARTDRVKTFPETVLKAEYDALYEEVSEAYEEAKTAAADKGEKFKYDTLDAFSAWYYDYDPALFSSAKAFCEDEAKYQITLRLAIFTIAQLADVRYTSEEADSALATYLDYQMTYFTSRGVSLTEEELKLLHGKGDASEGTKKYAEYVKLTIKFYQTYQGVTIAEEDVIKEYGTKDQILFRAVFQAMQIEVMEYLYENNTWTDTTP